jgi:hypothetical protein
MNPLQTKSYATLVLGDDGDELLETLLFPVHITLAIGMCIFGSGAASIFLSLHSFLSDYIQWTGSVFWDSVAMWAGITLAVACGLGFVFSKAILLKLVIRYRINHWFST